jgi:hypothetical protein
MRPGLFRRGVDKLLDEAELAIAAGKGRLDACGVHRAADGSHHANRAIERHRLGLAFQLVFAGVLVIDRRLRRALRGFPDEHRPRRSDRLDPRDGVHEVSGHHPLTLRAEVHCSFAGKHPGASCKAGCANVLPEHVDGGRQLERGPNGALDVVLLRDRRSPHRHHGVADELLDRAPVPADHLAARVEVAREQVPNLLGVSGLGERSEPDEVGEQDRHEPALRLGLFQRRCGGFRRQRHYWGPHETLHRPVGASALSVSSVAHEHRGAGEIDPRPER